MLLYCPKCLDSSIQLESSGKVHFIINGKHQETSQLLFRDVLGSGKEHFIEEFEQKIDEFMQWYKQFKHRDPIRTIQVFTNNYRCKNGCAFAPNMKFSVIDILIPAKKVVEIVRETGGRHGIETNLNSEDIII